METLIILVFLAGGFYGLVKGGDLLVIGGVEIARRLGVSTLVIGLTVIAWGTSAPEVVVSSIAAWQGSEAMSMGNVLGSNVANIGLVLGACALALPAVLGRRLARREVFWLFASLGVLWLACIDGAITRLEGSLLIGIFLLYNLHLLVDARRDARALHAAGLANVQRRVASSGTRTSPWLLLAVGTAMLAVGARLVVEGGKRVAFLFEVPEHVIGLTVFAVGTSLPELAAGLSSARRGDTDISIGNVVGSNVFNLLVVVGIAALIRPFGVPGDQEHDSVLMALDRDLPAILGFSALAVLLPWLGPASPLPAAEGSDPAHGGPSGDESRSAIWKGALLLMCYIAYIFALFVDR